MYHTIMVRLTDNHRKQRHKGCMSVSVCHICQCQCQSNFFSVARIAELLRSPRRRSRVTELCWGRIVKRNVLNVDGRRAETGIVGRQVAASSRGAMQ